MRKIAVLNQKGGVGKTTTVTNLAASLASRSYKVLALDFDPQAHLTIHLGQEPDTLEGNTYTVMTQRSDLTESIVKVRENLWLLGANIDLVGAESELVSVVGRETILREAVAGCKIDFDYMIIDCPPSLGLLTLNSLAAVDEVLIPVQPHFLALQGFGKLLQTITLVNQRINPSLKVSSILLCMYDKRTSLCGEVKADIANFLTQAKGTDCPWSDAQILPVHVRRNIKLAEAPSYGKTIYEYQSDCNGARDYEAIADYIDKGITSDAADKLMAKKITPQPEIEPAVETKTTIAQEALGVEIDEAAIADIVEVEEHKLDTYQPEPLSTDSSIPS